MEESDSEMSETMTFGERALGMIERHRDGDAGMYVLAVLLCLDAVTDLMRGDRNALETHFTFRNMRSGDSRDAADDYTLGIDWGQLYPRLAPQLTHNQLAVARAAWDLWNLPDEEVVGEVNDKLAPALHYRPFVLSDFFGGLDGRNTARVLLAVRVKKQSRAAREEGIRILAEAAMAAVEQ